MAIKETISNNGYSPSFNEYDFGINHRKIITTQISPKPQNKFCSAINNSDNISIN